MIRNFPVLVVYGKLLFLQVCSYVARNTDLNADKNNRYKKYGTSCIFGLNILYKSTEPIFICEGELDSLSIIEVGGNAIALDNDEIGIETTEKLAEELEKLQISFYRPNIYGDKKDANECLLTDKDSFAETVRSAEMVEEEVMNFQKEQYLKTSVSFCLSNFLSNFDEKINTSVISTGFNNLDALLDGGLYEGLYICGAISSLGKTAFVLQIAQGGTDVLIFSLEMARNELIARSISRLTLLLGDRNRAKTVRGITVGSRYKEYNKAEIDLIKQATSYYAGYAKHIFMNEGVGDIGVQDIRDILQKHCNFTENKPVVIIDYIQILAPYRERMSDKQNTDKVILELKRISRDYRTPVIGISSVNRAGYNTPISMESLKESGSIEFGSDCIWGLQLKGAGEKILM